VHCTVDGKEHTWNVFPRDILSDVLTHSGTPVNTGCDQGHCGVCLVKLNGVPVRSCSILAVQCEDAAIETVRADSEQSAQARAWMRACSALQCGFCSPAFVVRLADARLELDDQSGSRIPAVPSRTALSDVTCRCTGYSSLAAAAAGLLGDEEVPARQGRKEDTRLLTGHGDYVGARNRPRQLWAKVVRSTQAHATLTSVSADGARSVPGVVDVLTGAGLPDTLRLLHPTLAEDLHGVPVEPVLATEEVRYVGQPIAVVLAETPAAAEDGGRRVDVGYDSGPPEDGPEREGVLPPPTDPRWLGAARQSVGEDDEPEPAVVLRREFTLARQTGMPMETRGLLAEWDAEAGELLVHGVTKHPALNRAALAAALGLDEEQIRMPAGDVGGAFGVKGELYPEDLLVPWASMRTGRPVKWIEDRSEHLTAVNHSRGQRWSVRISAASDGRLLGADVSIVADIGAYRRPLTDLVPYLASAMFPGPYRFPRYRADVRCLLTTRAPTGPVRAPGRFEANFVRERMLDMLAEELGMDPVTLRRKNLLAAEDMPYDVGTVNEGPVHYDSGDFLGAFDAAVRERELRHAASASGGGDGGVHASPVPADDGLLRGSAVIPYVDKAGLAGGAPEVVVAEVLSSGAVRVQVAAAPSGQGHETTLAKIAGDVLGLPRERVEVCFGELDSGAQGIGTFASRTIMYAGNAVHLACQSLREAAISRAAAAHFLDTGSGGKGWQLADGAVLDASGETVATLAELAALNEEPLRAQGRYEIDGHTYPFGAVTCEVAVDPELFTVRVEHLAISCDAGTVIDEQVVRGQLAGGLAQGVGAALLEELAYEADGSLSATDLGGYLLPMADDLPDCDVTLREPGPSTTQTAPNPLGVKGVGEAGTAAASAAVASAVCAAVPALNPHLTDLPLTPTRLLTAWKERHCE
jgi:carbon-monoxide dehydrogenase large subunit